MRNETKKLIADKTQDGSWIHVRDLRGIIELETDLLQKTCDKRKKIIEMLTDQLKACTDKKRRQANELSKNHRLAPPEQQP